MSSKIFSVIPKIMNDLGSIGKDQKNTHQGYKFRGIEDMYNNIHPILVKHGVFCVPQVIESVSESFNSNKGTLSFRVMLKVNHKFYADDGSFIEVIIASEGIDTSDKATNKALSAAMKYAFIELLSIPTVDIEDSDRTSPEIETKKPQAQQQKPVATKPQAPAPRTSFSARPQMTQQKPSLQSVPQPTIPEEYDDSFNFGNFQGE